MASSVFRSSVDYGMRMHARRSLQTFSSGQWFFIVSFYDWQGIASLFIEKLNADLTDQEQHIGSVAIDTAGKDLGTDPQFGRQLVDAYGPGLIRSAQDLSAHQRMEAHQALRDASFTE